MGEGHNFPLGMSSKQEFELAYFEAKVQNFCFYATKALSALEQTNLKMNVFRFFCFLGGGVDTMFRGNFISSGDNKNEIDVMSSTRNKIT